MTINIQLLLKKFDLQTIETACIQYFIANNKLQVKNNRLIKSILSQNDQKINGVKLILKQNVEKIDFYELVKIFELLIPEEDRKINGAFFTPRILTDFIINELMDSYSLDIKICDPSCGCGAFLLESAIKIHEQFKTRVSQIIENNLYGVDLQTYSVCRAKILLTLLAIYTGEDPKEIKFNLESGNSLTINWKNIFPEVINKGGFDLIVGNPPYVKFQDLPVNLRDELYSNWKTLKNGNFNLYFAFFELGLNLLKDSGTLGYVTPNNYFTSLAGIDLREYLASNKFILKIIDFNHLKIFDAQTYVCITFLNKQKGSSFLYEKIQTKEEVKSLDNLKYSQNNYSDLNNKKWRLLRSTDKENIRKIENTGIKLGNLVSIRVGIATLKDRLYFIDGTSLTVNYYKKHYEGKTYLIEEDITLPIVKISDFKDQQALEANNKRVIFPYKKASKNSEIIPEIELKEKWPGCYEYFCAIKYELSTRDKGKKEYPEWYSYARTQGISYFGHKLLTPTFSSRPRFLYEKDSVSLFCNGYAIYLKQEFTNPLFSNQLSLKLLSKVLNSEVMNYYITRTSVSIEGGYPCYQKNFIELFGIPDFSSDEIEYLEGETDKGKIDSFLFKKYEIIIPGFVQDQNDYHKSLIDQEQNFQYLSSPN